MVTRNHLLCFSVVGLFSLVEIDNKYGGRPGAEQSMKSTSLLGEITESWQCTIALIVRLNLRLESHYGK